MCVLAGMSGGLVGVLWSTLVSAPWLASLRGPTVPGLAAERVSGLVAHAVALALGGGALGFLFWLGWALVALVNVPWYVAGAAFGLLAWAGVALPLLASVALRLQGLPRVAAVLAVEWLVTCVAVGLFCAVAWHRYA
jgi:hypothetical protein